MTVEVLQGSGAAMREIADDEAALVLTSPPYFPVTLEKLLSDGRAVRGREDELEQQILTFAAQLRPVFDECKRVLAPDGILIVQTRDVRLGSRLVGVEAVHRLHAEAQGLHLYTRYLWLPLNSPPDRLAEARAAGLAGRPRSIDPEVFLVFFAGEGARAGEPLAEDQRLLSHVLLKTGFGKLREPHRHQSPLPLVECFIRTYTKPGDLVVDPFAGGGTTLVAAERLGRRGFGFDIDAESIRLTDLNVQES